MSEAWEGLLYSNAQQKKVAAVRAVLVDRFPEASEAVLSVQARQLLSTAETAGNSVTRRADDAKAVKRFSRLLKEADQVLQGLSSPTRESFLHRAYVEGMGLTLTDLVSIAETVGARVPKTPFSSRENVTAIFLVEDARQIWSCNKAREAPAKGLNAESPFAAFLVDLFKALSVGSDPRSAFSAWERYRESGVF